MPSTAAPEAGRKRLWTAQRLHRTQSRKIHRARRRKRQTIPARQKANRQVAWPRASKVAAVASSNAENSKKESFVRAAVLKRVPWRDRTIPMWSTAEILKRKPWRSRNWSVIWGKWPSAEKYCLWIPGILRMKRPSLSSICPILPIPWLSKCSCVPNRWRKWPGILSREPF